MVEEIDRDVAIVSIDGVIKCGHPTRIDMIDFCRRNKGVALNKERAHITFAVERRKRQGCHAFVLLRNVDLLCPDLCVRGEPFRPEPRVVVLPSERSVAERRIKKHAGRQQGA